MAVDKPEAELYGGKAGQDNWKTLEAIIAKYDIPLRDVLESFAIYTRRINVTRFLAHYELYKLIADKPGSIVECGVYQGNSFFAFHKFLEIFHPGDRIRHVIGFDDFKGLRLTEEDGPEYPGRSKVDGGWKSEGFKGAFDELMMLHQNDQFVQASKRCFLIDGDILETVPQYVEENPGLRISLLHLDVDVFKPTKTALDHLYDRVVPGGLIVLDEYAMMEWGGESSALEVFFEERKLPQPDIKTFSWTSTPSAYFFKPWS
ncbi:TylF/MycF/NovP-related O-methyltransferase [Roseibium sp.]|uniref:TylF/MycF/NovP-related O-methyltransferase n=1 Tax=Roseibium sp. TaxID=1936156 RepID=UPI003BAB0D63